MVAFPTASKAKIHVIPSKTLQANAILACEIINAASITGFFFSALSGNFLVSSYHVDTGYTLLLSA